ncbi:MAG: TRAP transporter large permease subunit [Gammaproteobacteria bacterium]|nr:TRAP transporter large permease subunit [Gammaproteobacteria bacterium]MDD9799779.1 TRAP transporter large permease subunit [Gammaproteobacteria bacterium]MDD9816201.1 TRAP transporter large permease subunit [Gammaproteobacteria bacterium]MDD9871653.1 TRAP transporter large permease subunit [Gammaproteobacteria bacterium]
MVHLADYLPLLMFAVLGALLFCGYPVAFVLGGIALAFGLIGIAVDAFVFIQFFNIVPRIWGGIAENLVLTAIPMFIFMGTMLERSGIANELITCLQTLLRRVPGGLAMSVTLMGTVLAATTGIIGASVVMMTLLALPMMLRQKYNQPLATGTIAASGTLGILIPPSIMLVIMADLLARSVGNMFVAALFPGLMLAGFYLLYILVVCRIKPQLAPPLADGSGPADFTGLVVMAATALVPTVFLIFLVLGSILFGWATPTEAAGVGAAGAILLAVGVRPLVNAALAGTRHASPGSRAAKVDGNFARRWRAEVQGFGGMLHQVACRSALTGGMLFMIFLGATAFSFVFRALGGDDLVVGIVESMELGSWGILIILMAVVFVLGFFFDWIEITLIVLPVFAPIIELLDFAGHVEPRNVVYWFAILMAVNLQTSFLTPPFGFALFYMKGVAPPQVRIQQIYRGIIPFVLLQLCGLGLVMAFPQIALWLPGKLLP